MVTAEHLGVQDLLRDEEERQVLAVAGERQDERWVVVVSADGRAR